MGIHCSSSSVTCSCAVSGATHSVQVSGGRTVQCNLSLCLCHKFSFSTFGSVAFTAVDSKASCMASYRPCHSCAAMLIFMNAFYIILIWTVWPFLFHLEHTLFHLCCSSIQCEYIHKSQCFCQDAGLNFHVICGCTSHELSSCT